MSLQTAKILLEKINVLYRSIEIDGQVLSIERDLMLSYIRQFYEALLTVEQAETASIPTPAPVVVPPPAPKPAEEKKVVVEKPIEVAVQPPAQVPVPTPVAEVEIPPVAAVPPPTPPVVEMEVIMPPAPPKVEEEVIVVMPPPVVPTQVFPEPPKPKAAQKPLIKSANERVDQSELFEEKTKKELSDKLGETPLDDIKKGISLNEKILYINELFNGDFQAFETAVSALNNAGNFAASRSFLSELASKFDWQSKEKFAKPFIRLVRRRYN